MNAKVYYFSGTGNTKLISEKLVERFGARNMGAVQMIPAESVDTIAAQHGDVIGIGFPVYDLKPPKIMMELLKRTGKTSSQNKAFVFNTYTSYPLDANAYVIKALHDKGFTVIAEDGFKSPGACVYLYANPNNVIIKKSAAFSRGIDAQIDCFVERVIQSVDTEAVKIKFNPLNRLHQAFSKTTLGNIFYKNLQKNENCINCGQCVSVCPDSNLYIKDNKLIIERPNGCMCCLRCVLICKRRAINFSSSKRRGDYTKECIERAYENAVT